VSATRNDCLAFCQRSFAGPHGNDADAPIPAIRASPIIRDTPEDRTPRNEFLGTGWRQLSGHSRHFASR
jgi:hypothetical protein